MWPVQKRETGHMWEIEFQPLGLFVFGRNKGIISGVYCYILGVYGNDFAGVLAGNVLQHIWRVKGLLGVNLEGQNQAKPFMGFSRFLTGTPDIYFQNFMSTIGGVFSCILQ